MSLTLTAEEIREIADKAVADVAHQKIATKTKSTGLNVPLKAKRGVRRPRNTVIKLSGQAKAKPEITYGDMASTCFIQADVVAQKGPSRDSNFLISGKEYLKQAFINARKG